MMNNVIEATILTGKFKGEDVLLLGIQMKPTDMPFEFKRLQFPMRLAFAMTNNKAQGQLSQECGLNLENTCSSMWPAHASESLLIYSFTHQMEKRKILCTAQHFNKCS